MHHATLDVVARKIVDGESSVQDNAGGSQPFQKSNRICHKLDSSMQRNGTVGGILQRSHNVTLHQLPQNIDSGEEPSYCGDRCLESYGKRILA